LPEITVTGVVDNAYYNISVTPVVEVTDLNLNIISITLNGNPFINGTIVTAENTYTLVVQAVDKAGNTAEKTITFTIDKTEPGISELIPATGTKTTKSSIMVSGKTEPDAIVKINGIDVPVSSYGSFSKEITLSKGENTITIASTDLAGNTNTEMITITYQPKKEQKGFIPAFETVAFLVAMIGVCVMLLRRRKR
jgi:hypothetical protein